MANYYYYSNLYIACLTLALSVEVGVSIIVSPLLLPSALDVLSSSHRRRIVVQKEHRKKKKEQDDR